MFNLLCDWRLTELKGKRAGKLLGWAAGRASSGEPIVRGEEGRESGGRSPWSHPADRMARAQRCIFGQVCPLAMVRPTNTSHPSSQAGEEADVSRHHVQSGLVCCDSRQLRSLYKCLLCLKRVLFIKYGFKKMIYFLKKIVLSIADLQ